jgi:hypothetical protein
MVTVNGPLESTPLAETRTLYIPFVSFSGTLNEQEPAVARRGAI